MYELWQMLSVMFGGCAIGLIIGQIAIYQLRIRIMVLERAYDEVRRERDFYEEKSWKNEK